MLAVSGECKNIIKRDIKIFEKTEIQSTDKEYFYRENDLSKLVIFPNPNNGNFSLKIDLFKLESYSIKIFRNVSGELIYSKSFSPSLLNNEHSISLNLFSGIYIVKVETLKNSLSKQFFVEKY